MQNRAVVESGHGSVDVHRRGGVDGKHARAFNRILSIQVDPHRVACAEIRPLAACPRDYAGTVLERNRPVRHDDRAHADLGM